MGGLNGAGLALRAALASTRAARVVGEAEATLLDAVENRSFEVKSDGFRGISRLADG